MTREDIKTITDIVHKTIYGFFDVCGDDEETPMTDKDKLLLKINKAICTNIRALEQEPKTGQFPEEDTGIKLDEAIKRYASNAEFERNHGNLQGCLEFRQLVEWLKEIKDYRERIPSYEAGYNDAKREIALRGEYERAYERGKADAQNARWIPVSERLPEAEYGESDSVLVCFENETQDVLYFDGSNWRYPTGEVYVSVNYKNGWHNKVIAWMPLPKPYEPQERSEGE